jgi:hypothetical protein
MGQRDGWLLDRLIVTADAVARHCQLVFHLWLVLQINDGIGLIAGITPTGKARQTWCDAPKRPAFLFAELNRN